MMKNIIDISKIDTAVLRRQDLLEGISKPLEIFYTDNSITQNFLNIIMNELL